MKRLVKHAAIATALLITPAADDGTPPLVRAPKQPIVIKPGYNGPAVFLYACPVPYEPPYALPHDDDVCRHRREDHPYIHGEPLEKRK